MRDGGDPVTVVTGGTGALGRWVVKALLDEGHTVHVPWRTDAARDELAELVGGDAAGLRLWAADVTSPDSVDALFRAVAEAGGRLDALLNLVGGFVMGGVEETAPAAWHRMIDLNATSVFLCVRAAVPLLRAAGGGRVVNVASFPAVERGSPGMSAYAASKAAVVSLTRSLAKELREDRVTVNAVAPEIIDTPRNRDSMPGADRSRWLDPVEVAGVVRMLLRPEAGVVTGSVLMLARGGRAGSGGGDG